ncbi:glycoside hydrolase [Basidiobolus meristosporus CBS 931.73]|uniref:beta-N-acetylhexosaminidase n=1 Tax=Basidiobolus meristosporus CBS 931.73 TaxID=1314790 RepID=A0A1Y1YSK9_9FUNG|nr:glycoside hydrolase [Basidiobolus meristosporus CBS 931.73]|eukprot:ORY01001.1 glycoside hydrolase [Basidiobolus meristosporus CBS 931.73]
MPLLKKTGTFFKKALDKAKDILGEEERNPPQSQPPPGSSYYPPQSQPPPGSSYYPPQSQPPPGSSYYPPQNSYPPPNNSYYPPQNSYPPPDSSQYPPQNSYPPPSPVAPPRPDLVSGEPPQVIPTPKNVTQQGSSASIFTAEAIIEINCSASWLLGNALVLESWLRKILQTDEERVHVINEFKGEKSPTLRTIRVNFNSVRFGDPSMNGRYRMITDADQQQIYIEAQNPEGAAYAVSTLVQLLEEDPQNEFRLPSLMVEDWPSVPDEYRGLMLDVAREFHSIEHIQSIIDLCSLYKLRYLHLHLTDNENFMIPPPDPEFYNGVDLSEIGKAIHNVHGEPAYSIQELKDLNLYAFSRGIILVPEFDMPGHSEALIRSSPEFLGTYYDDGESRIRSLVNFANDAVVNCVILPMLHHVAKLFPYSPYMHVGFDEVDVTNAEEDPHFKEAINRRRHVSSDKELLWDFMGFMNHQIKHLNISAWYPPPNLPGTNMPADPGFYQPVRRSIVWESFAAHSTPLPPRDILVMAWSMQDYRPDDLIRDGFSIINGAWSPLYVVGTDGSSVKEILKWQGSCEFGGIPERGKKTEWVTLPKQINTPYTPGPRVHGSSIVVWESEVDEEICCLKDRLGAMSERLWTHDPHGTCSNTGNDMLPRFESRLSRVNKLIDLICGCQ